MEKYYYTWENFGHDIKEIMVETPISYYKTIVGIAFGGLSLLSCFKNNFPDKRYEIIFAKSYQGKKKKQLVIEQFNPILWENPILLIDDIADSGGTLKTIKEKLEVWDKKVDILTLFHRKNSLVVPRYNLNDAGNLWIVFPWEKNV